MPYDPNTPTNPDQPEYPQQGTHPAGIRSAAVPQPGYGQPQYPQPGQGSPISTSRDMASRERRPGNGRLWPAGSAVAGNGEAMASRDIRRRRWGIADRRQAVAIQALTLAAASAATPQPGSADRGDYWWHCAAVYCCGGVGYVRERERLAWRGVEHHHGSFGDRDGDRAGRNADRQRDSYLPGFD